MMEPSRLAFPFPGIHAKEPSALLRIELDTGGAFFVRIRSQECFERAQQTVRHGFRRLRPDGWDLYPPHRIKRVDYHIDPAAYVDELAAQDTSDERMSEDWRRRLKSFSVVEDERVPRDKVEFRAASCGRLQGAIINVGGAPPTPPNVDKIMAANDAGFAQFCLVCEFGFNGQFCPRCGSSKTSPGIV